MSKNVRPNRRQEPKLRQMDRQGWKSLGAAALKIGLTCIFAVGLPYGAYLYYRNLSDQGYFTPKHISIIGNVRADDADILDASGLKMEDANLAEMDVRSIESGIETLPWIKEAHVKIELPDTANIEITEHEPLGVVNDTALSIVDGSGALIKLWTDEDALMAPIVTIDKPIAERSREIVKAFEIVRMAHRLGYLRRIHEINYDSATGYTLFTATAAIRLGYDRFEARIKRLMQVENVLESRQVVAEYILLDADDALDRVVVKPKIAAAMPNPASGVEIKADSPDGNHPTPGMANANPSVLDTGSKSDKIPPADDAQNAAKTGQQKADTKSAQNKGSEKPPTGAKPKPKAKGAQPEATASQAPNPPNSLLEKPPTPRDNEEDTALSDDSLPPLILDDAP